MNLLYSWRENSRIIPILLLVRMHTMVEQPLHENYQVPVGAPYPKRIHLESVFNPTDIAIDVPLERNILSAMCNVPDTYVKSFELKPTKLLPHSL